MRSVAKVGRKATKKRIRNYRASIGKNADTAAKPKRGGLRRRIRAGVKKFGRKAVHRRLRKTR